MFQTTYMSFSNFSIFRNIACGDQGGCILRSHAIPCDPMHGPCKKSHPMHGHAWTMHGHAWDYSWKLKNFKSRKKSFEFIFWKLEVASKKNFHLKKISNFEKFEFDESGHFEFYHFWLSSYRRAGITSKE